MSFVIARFKERITIDRNFAQELADELDLNNFFDGTILLVANEILLNPSYVFNYNIDVDFPGRNDIVMVADRFGSAQGGKIDITGSRGSNGTDGTDGKPGESGKDTDLIDSWGGPGHPGNHPDRTRSDGKNIKIFCNQLGDRLVKLELISNGGAGGPGGKCGNGGNGGPGGDGGDGAIIKGLFHTLAGVTNLHSKGGNPGKGSTGGEGGFGHHGTGNRGDPGEVINPPQR